MKHRKVFLYFCILVISIISIVFIVGVLHFTLNSGNLLIKSDSPDNKYTISIYEKRGTGLLNIPIDISIKGSYKNLSDHIYNIFTLKSQIDNDSANVLLESNIWLFWNSNDSAYVVLLGEEQFPEIIQITFNQDNKPLVNRERSTKLAQEILSKNGVNLELINPKYW